jgi:nicotinamidase-related amidase
LALQQRIRESTMNTMHAGASVLVLVDYQTRLLPAIHGGSDVAAIGHLLARAARLIGVPVLGTEQNPDKLGPNVECIKAGCDRTVAKMHFDACKDGLLAALAEAHAEYSQVVIAGCEAHVCLMQTALGVLASGKRVWVVANASGSRRATDHVAAMDRLAQAGATIVTHEMVVFEWLGDCMHPRFREALELVKAAG